DDATQSGNVWGSSKGARTTVREATRVICSDQRLYRDVGSGSLGFLAETGRKQGLGEGVSVDAAGGIPQCPAATTPPGLHQFRGDGHRRLLRGPSPQVQPDR